MLTALLGGGVWLQGFIAAALGAVFRLPPWWLPINLFFPPLLAWGSAMDIPPGWPLAGFLLLLVVYGSVFRSGVPLYLSGEGAKRALLDRLPEKLGLKLLDAGGGTGSVLVYLARHRPDLALHGVEQAPVPCLLAWLRTRHMGCRVRWGSLWDEPLQGYDVIYAFLSPAPMLGLREKLRKEMKRGGLFISNTFPLPDVHPDETIPVGGLHGGTLYLYRYESIIGTGGDGRATATEDDDDQNRR